MNTDCILGLATIANMGAEVGATTSTFPYTPNMRAYLNATARAPVARAADGAASEGFLSADEGVEYDEVIEIVSDHRFPDTFITHAIYAEFVRVGTDYQWSFHT